MPKYDIHLQAGERVTDEARGLIEKYFPEFPLSNLERLGGLLRISLSTSSRKSGKGEDIIVDDAYVKEIQSISIDIDKTTRSLRKLSASQLREFSRIINQPIRSNATKAEIISAIIRSLSSHDIWQSIANSNVTKHEPA